MKLNYLFKIVLAFIIVSLFFTKDTFAIYPPQEVANNKYGIHIIGDSELNDAAQLVNSSGGDWGYVTFVITEAERDSNRWQKVFDEMRRLHLIPIVRIATKAVQGGIWERPKTEEINNWIAFLNSLNWVVQNRYVVIGNEPNHAKEWGNTLEPEKYASYLVEFSKKLKEANTDFFVLPAGFDASAPDSRVTMDEENYLAKMKSGSSDVFQHIDGWTSHSYPNPDFSGSETATGRGSIKTYEWELSILKKLGVENDLPVFITETGWKHNEGVTNSEYLDDTQISERLKQAYINVWSDPKVVAVTPFILSYSGEPFESFSWKKKDGNFYDFYHTVLKLPKEKGSPKQEDKGVLLAIFINPIQNYGIVFDGNALVRNIGQTIWEGRQISLDDNKEVLTILESYPLQKIEPYAFSLIHFKAVGSSGSGLRFVKFVLKNGENEITNEFPFEVYLKKGGDMQSENIFAKMYAQVKSLLESLGLQFGPMAQW